MRSVQVWTRARLRRLLPLLLAAGLVTGTAVVTATPALAASTLCSGFTACEANPYTDHGWGANYTNGYWGQYSGDNCTNYVAYYEQTVNGRSATRPSWLAAGHNADDWASEAQSAGITLSNTPVVGAIAQWGDYSWNGNTGHVGIVEKVLSSTTIEVSWDSYSAGPYKWVKLNSTDANTSTAVGWPNNFIYLGVGSGGSGGSSPPPPPPPGHADYGIVRLDPNTNAYDWYFMSSVTHQPIPSLWGQANGGPGDIPVFGDVDGDGKADYGIYRVVNGVGYWYFMSTVTYQPIPGMWGVTHGGLAGDIPVVGDVDHA
jgi:surface antigen